jgi:hypothetical protein
MNTFKKMFIGLLLLSVTTFSLTKKSATGIERYSKSREKGFYFFH